MIGVKITALLIVLTVIAKYFIESLLANESIGRKWDMALGNNYPKYVYVLYTQIGENAFIWYDHGGLKYLKEQCHQYYGQTTWYCLYLSDK